MEHLHRIERISELLHHEVAGVILREFDFGGPLATVSSVEIASNRQQASVYVTVYPYDKSKEVLKKLTDEVGLIQQQLNKALKMRPVPKIIFKLDDSEERSRHIMDLLDKTD